MKSKFILLLLLSTLLLPISSHASTYIVQRSGFGEIAGACLGGLLGGLIGTQINEQRQERASQKAYQLEAIKREYTYDLMRNYNPLYHYEYVDCVSRSCLSEHEKTALIGYFNEKRYEWMRLQNPYLDVIHVPTHVYHHHIY